MQSRKNWKSRVLTAALTLGAFALTVPAFSQIVVQFGRNPPPPIRYERRPPPPGQGFVWADGYWNWAGGRYAWVPGRWSQPPYAGAYWSHPHYDRYEDGWHYHEGHWDRDDHGDHRDDRGDHRDNDGRDRDRDRR